jgi:hypothetical protein
VAAPNMAGVALTYSEVDKQIANPQIFRVLSTIVNPQIS